MKKIIYLLVGIVLFGGLYYSCAPEELPGSIHGTVVDKATGEPIKSAGVELSPSGLKTVTGSEGQFEFTELDPGKYTLLITKTGYIDGVSHTIEVKPGQQAKGDVQIEKLPPALKVVNDNREEISILDFGSAEDDVARSFSVFNDGTETLEWELTATADWIKSVSKTTGTLSAGATQAIIITIDRAKLSSGENKTTVHITSNSGNKQLVVTATNNFQVTKLNVLPTTDITSTSATLNGEVVEDGSPIYTERGFVYAETTQPTISACIQKIAAPFSDSKTFAATISDLVEGKKYYVRAYAIQSGKEMYSVNEVLFVTNTVVLPSVVTSAITNVGKNSATAGGNVTNDGGASVTERGVVYSTNKNPTIADNKVSSGTGKGAYTCNLTNLQEATTYYVRAYAINEKGTAYGEEVSFTTSKEILLPSVTTSTITQVSETTAVAGGNVTSDGGASVTERGVCIATVSNPTTSHSKITAAGGTGTFTCAITGLQEGTTYFVRAYATNSKGTAYGEQVSFTTAVTISLPSVTTSAVTQITETSAVAGGNVTSDGNASVTERGVVYSLSANPSISDLSSTIVRSGSGTGSFTCNLTGLEEGKKYYVRAYAMNSKGTAYGTEVTFTTNKQSGNGTENGYAYVDLGLSVKWATMNVGASQAEGYGSYFAWGETTTKSTYDWSTYKYCNGSYNTLTKYNTSSSYGTVDNKTQLELSDDAARVNWGGSWRMPTDAEWTELREQCTWTWTTQNGVKGYKVTSKKSGYTNNSIFLPVAGYRDDSLLYGAGSVGDYWSSSLYTGGSPYYAWFVGFNSSNVISSSNYRGLGFSVRPVCP